MTEGIELLNQEEIRTLGEKENYRHFPILEADTTKQKISKNTSEERENYSKPIFTAEISSKR